VSAEGAAARSRLSREDIHDQWENDYLNPELDRFYDAAFDRILKELGDTKGKSLLDIGCGYCHHTRRLLKGGFKITASDFSEVPLAHARKILVGHEDQVTLRQADATELPFPSNSFDYILMWGVLMHIPDAPKALSEIVRVLKPGGTLVLSENNRWSIDVTLVEPLVNYARRLILRKPLRERNRVPLGIEEWHTSQEGRLVVRKTDVKAIERFCGTLGLKLVRRLPGQFTENYTRIPTRTLKRMIHRFNRLWFLHGPPQLATGNILFFKKVSPASALMKD
jgi:ubiquinone/menaquinone biosynthesis C-methylase UbiE